MLASCRSPHAQTLAAPAARHRRPTAFTLAELLGVMAVMAVLLGLVVPVVTSLKSASDITAAAYDLADTLEQARAYAMSHNTYVYVGIEEVDSTLFASGKQKSPGKGRIGVAVVASRDGTRGYDVGNTAAWTNNYASISGNLFTLGKLKRYENLHLVDLGTPPAAGGMARYPHPGDDAIQPLYLVGNDGCASVTPFDYPLGKPVGAGDYSFTKVIQYDPQGIPRIQSASNTDAVTTWIEIGLQQSRGASVPALSGSPASGPIAALQIDGLSGSVHVYRP